MNVITAVISLREGSRRLKNKNSSFILDKRTSVDVDDMVDLACARAWLDMNENVSQIAPYCVDEEQFLGGNSGRIVFLSEHISRKAVAA